MTAIVSDLKNESARRHLFLQRRRKALSAPASSVFLTFQLAFRRRDFFARLTWLKFSNKMKKLNPLKWFKILCLFCLSRVSSFSIMYILPPLIIICASAMHVSQRCADAADLKKRKQPTHVRTGYSAIYRLISKHCRSSHVSSHAGCQRFGTLPFLPSHLH